MGDDRQRIQNYLRARRLARVGWVPVTEVYKRLRELLPRLDDAVRFMELVETALGSRVVRDTFVADEQIRLRFVDPARPSWLVGQAQVTLRFDTPPPPVFERPANMPPPLKLPAPKGEHRRTAELYMNDGFTYFEAKYNEDGVGFERTVAIGDGRNGEPCAYYPERTQQHRPFALWGRPELAREMSLEAFAELVADMQPHHDVPARITMPAPCPGGPGGLHNRAMRILKQRFWDRPEQPDGGVVVLDAMHGEVVAWGDDAESALRTFQRELQVRVPEPPPDPERPRSPPEPGRTRAEVRDTPEGKQIRMEAHIVFRPPRWVPWPRPMTPDQVPALMLPVPPTPPIPPMLARMGFHRCVRLMSDQGHFEHAWLRLEDSGFTLVGDRAVVAIDPTSFEEDLRAGDARRIETIRSFDPDRPARLRHDEYPVRVFTWNTHDMSGYRYDRLVPGSTGFSAEWRPTNLDDGFATRILRVDGMAVHRTESNRA